MAYNVPDFTFYTQGWNDFSTGKKWPGTFNSTTDYRDGWHDARDYEDTHGKKPEPV